MEHWGAIQGYARRAHTCTYEYWVRSLLYWRLMIDPWIYIFTCPPNFVIEGLKGRKLQNLKKIHEVEDRAMVTVMLSTNDNKNCHR